MATTPLTEPQEKDEKHPAPPFPCLPADLSFFATAPCRFRNEVELDVTPQRLFAILADESSWPTWASPGITRVTWTSPRPFGVGATRTVAMLGGLEVFERFFVWKDGEELAFYLTGATQEVWTRFAERYEVVATAPGKCRLAWTVAYEPVGGFARARRFAGPLIDGGMNFALRRYLRNLARYCRA
jgi:hypothetical protein